MAIKDRGLARELFLFFNLLLWSEISLFQYRAYAYQYEGSLFDNEVIHKLGNQNPNEQINIWSISDIKNTYSKEHISDVVNQNLEFLRTESKRKTFFFYLNTKQEIDNYQKELIRLTSEKDMDDFFQQVCLSLISGRKFNEEALTTALIYHKPLSRSCGLIIDRTWRGNVEKI